MDFLTILAHTFCFIAYIIMFFYTFFNVKRKLIVFLQIIVCILFGLQYFILHAYTAAFCSVFGIIEFTLFYFKGKNKFFTLPIIPILCAIVYIVFGIITWDGYMSILPVMCNLIAVISFWMSKPIYIKSFNVPISIMWIIYNTSYMAYVGTVCQSILLLIDFYFIYMFIKKYHKEEKEE